MTDDTGPGADMVDQGYQNELAVHRDFLLRNVRMIVDVLAGEQS
jgi:hypothetical protein